MSSLPRRSGELGPFSNSFSGYLHLDEERLRRLQDRCTCLVDAAPFFLDAAPFFLDSQFPNCNFFWSVNAP